MSKTNFLLVAVVCGATGLAAAQMMPNPSQNPTMPGSTTGQPGRPGTMGGEIPDTVGGQTNSGQTTGQNTTQNPKVPKVDDATLERDVKQQLSSDPALSGVQVAAHNGKVELTGSVPSKDDRKKAKEMAKSVPGVTSVKEKVTVGGGSSSNSGMSSGSSSNSSAQNTAGSISGNAGTSNSSSSAPNSSPATTQPTNPQQTTPQTGPPSNPPSSDTTPHASTTTPQGSGGHLVYAAYQQSGSNAQPEAAPSQNPKSSSSASTNSANHSGSNTPVNITLTPVDGQGSAANVTLQSRIENALRNEPTLTNSHVAVNVNDSTIDLTGTVGSSKDKQTAERIAQSFGANRKLNDKLMVTGHGHSDLAPDHSAMNNSGTGAAQDSSKPH